MAKKLKTQQVEETTLIPAEVTEVTPEAPAVPQVKTHTFKTVDGVFQITVNKDFLAAVPAPETVDLVKLFAVHDMSKFLHNENGAAVVVLSNGHEEHWINGQRVLTPEVK